MSRSLNSGAQTLEQRDSIPVWSANPCLSRQPSPWEAESPAQRHPFLTEQESLAGQGCHTLLPAPSFLAQFPWAGVPQEVLLHTGLQEGTQTRDLEEFPASTTPEGQRQKASLVPFYRQTKRGKGRPNTEMD